MRIAHVLMEASNGVLGCRLCDRNCRWFVRRWRWGIFIPVLIYLFGFTQHAAQGTSLAVLLPPIGLLAAMRYYNAGHVNFKVAGLLAAGFFVGAYFGAWGATQLNQDLLKRLFGGFLLVIALHMIFHHVPAK